MLEYSLEQLDIIKEVFNIALGNSATSLSELLNVKINMSVPNVNIEPISNFMSNIKDTEVIGKILIIKGQIEGSILMLFDIDTARRMVRDVDGDNSLPQDELEDIRVSFIEEVCNIVGSTYIRTIANFLNIEVEVESSSLLYDSLTAILSYTFMEEEQFYDEIVNIQTDFKYRLDSGVMNVYFYFVPRKGNMSKILNGKSEF